MIDTGFIYNENCIDTMERLYLSGIETDLILCSPPYDNLRSYEDTLDFDFESIAEAIVHVMAEGSALVWVVSDQIINYGESGTRFRQVLKFMELGLTLHQTLIYSKGVSWMPDKTRYGKCHEDMYVFSKGRMKNTHIIHDKKNKWAGLPRNGSTNRQRDGSLAKATPHTINEVSARMSIWQFATGWMNSTKDEEAYQHPAIFPEKLAHDHIVSWTNEGDLVFDPCMGSGTTAKVARNLNRRFIGSEIVEKYCDIANKRLAKDDLFFQNEGNYIVRPSDNQSNQAQNLSNLNDSDKSDR